MIGSRQYHILKTLANEAELTSREFGFTSLPETLFKSLVRLERRGLVRSRKGPHRARQGGKAQRLFGITTEGVVELSRYEATLGA